MTRTLFALSQHATACDNKLQIAVRNDMRLFLRTTKYYSVLKKYYSSTTLYYKVLLRTTLHYKVLLCTTKYYSSTTLYYKVLLQYCSVLHSTTPVLLCTTKYYSSGTLYYTVLFQYYSVLHSTTPVLLCTTKYYSKTTPYYTVLLQYYSVLQSTTPELLRTTQYYSSTTLYYKVLLQYYSVLQSTTPVVLCTTQYYSSTTLYYKVLLQYYSVLQSTTPVLLCTTKYYSHDWSASPMKLYLHCAEQQRCFANITECCACQAKWLSWLIRITYATLFTMRGAAEMSLQHHQILRLPRKVTLIIDPLHTWNVIYNARSNKCHCPNSPNTAPATKNESHDWSLTQMKRYLQCAEQHAS